MRWRALASVVSAVPSEHVRAVALGSNCARRLQKAHGNVGLGGCGSAGCGLLGQERVFEGVDAGCGLFCRRAGTGRQRTGDPVDEANRRQLASGAVHPGAELCDAQFAVRPLRVEIGDLVDERLAR